MLLVRELRCLRSPPSCFYFQLLRGRLGSSGGPFPVFFESFPLPLETFFFLESKNVVIRDDGRKSSEREAPTLALCVGEVLVGNKAGVHVPLIALLDLIRLLSVIRFVLSSLGGWRLFERYSFGSGDFDHAGVSCGVLVELALFHHERVLLC